MARKTSTPAPSKEVKSPSFIAYSVQNRSGDKKNVWTGIGAAWDHQDGKGLTITLSCLPINGQITLRVPGSFEDE